MAQQSPWDPTQPIPPAPTAPPPTRTEDSRHHRRGGVGAGVVLIAIGLVFLAANWLPGITWWQLWPAIIIAIGAVMMVTPDGRDGWGLERVMDGLGTVILGGVLLGNMTGYISWAFWGVLFTLWPVFLIAAGIGIIARAVRQRWIGAIGTLVIWAAFAYAAATTLTGAGGLAPVAPILTPAHGQAFSLAEPIDTTRRATLHFDGGAGDIRVGPSAAEKLVTATGSSPFGTPSLSVSRDGESADVRVGAGDSNGVVIGPGFPGGRIDLGLSDTVLWDATLDAGASNLTADFSRIKLGALTLKTGVSSTDLRLGPVSAEAPEVRAEIKAGVSAVTVSIPKGTPAQVHANDGLTALTVSDDFKKTSAGVWTTADATTGRGYDIWIESGVGSVSIRTY